RRQLQEVGAEVLTQPAHSGEVICHPSFGVTQLHAMRSELSDLDRVQKPRWRLLPPVLHCTEGRQPVKRVVDLHGVELACVVVEPRTGRRGRRIKPAAPIPIRPARTANPKSSGLAVDGPGGSHLAHRRARRRSSISAWRISVARSSARKIADGWYVTNVGRPSTANGVPRLAAIGVVRPSTDLA